MKLLSDESTILQLHQKYDKKLADDWTIYRNIEQRGAKQDVSQVASLSWNRSVSSSMQSARIPSSAWATKSSHHPHRLLSGCTSSSLPGGWKTQWMFSDSASVLKQSQWNECVQVPHAFALLPSLLLLPPTPPPKGVEGGSAAYIVVACCTTAFPLVQRCASGTFSPHHSFIGGGEQSNSTTK